MSSDAVNGDVVVRIEEGEWEEVSRRLRLSLEPDERSVLGKLALVLGGGRRRWCSTDRFRLVVFDAGPDDGDATFLVSPRLLEAWPLVSAGTGAAVLRLSTSDDREVISIEGPGGALSLDHDPRSTVDVDRLLTEQLDPDGVSFSVDAEAFHELVRLARVAPAGPFLDEDHEVPLMWLTVDGRSLCIDVDWSELGVTGYRIPVEGGGAAVVSASPMFLHELIKALDPGEVTVTIPADVHDSLRVRQGAVTGLLMPIDPMRATIDRVEQALALVFGDDVVHPKLDGVYRLSSDGVPVEARILFGDPVRLEVFAQVLVEVDLSEELLYELNQLNAATGMVKVLWNDGTVLVTGELVASTLDPEEVAAVYRRVNDFADGLGPALAVRFGGRAMESGQDSRWADYRQAIIRAELIPGEWLPLNGPDATAAFPFTEPVYVITAHNPHGRQRPAQINAQDTARLAADLVEAGAGIVRAVGGSSDGSIAEDSFLAWDIDLDTALHLGNRYEQDAIFELTGDSVAIIDVTSGRRDVMPRRSNEATA